MDDCYDSQLDRVKEAKIIKSSKMYEDFAQMNIPDQIGPPFR